MTTMTRNWIFGSLFAVLLLSANVVQGQLLANLEVDVTEQDGIFTYDYTLSNGFLSSDTINVFAITVAVGDDVAIGTVPFTPEEIEMGALGARLDAPEGWAGSFDPRLVEFADDDPNTPRNESCDVVGSRGVSDTFQVGWVTGDGFSTSPSDPAALLPGGMLAFTLQSEYGPGEQDYIVAGLDDGNCPNEFFGFADGRVLAPTVAPIREPMLACDFNGDGECDVQDVDLLSVAVGTDDLEFDFNSDSVVSTMDITDYLASDDVNRLNGDADFNGTVEFADFLILADNFGDAGVWSSGDFDGSNDVAFADFLILADNFGGTIGAETLSSVPEPSASLLCGVMLCGLLPLRKRSRV